MAFTATDYLSANPDVAGDPYFKQNPLDHFKQYGINEGRSWGSPADKVSYTLYGGSAGFPTDPAAKNYLSRNPDVWGSYKQSSNNATADEFAKQHFLNFGVNEGRAWGMPEPATGGTGGGGGGGGSSPMPMPRNDLIDIFQPDKYPESRSGLPEEYQTQILEKLIPKLLESVEGYEGNIDKSTQAAQELFETQSRRGMKDQLQGILNSLAGRNMLNSSVASDAISKGMGDIVQTGAQKGYESQMNNAALKAQLPAMLANIAQLGQSSTSENQLEPYKLLAQYDWNLM